MYFYWGVCKKPDQNSISRSMFWFFGFLSFWRVKNSYLIRPSSENSNFLWEMLFLCPQHACKKSRKNSTSRSLFRDFMPAGKIHPLCYKTGIGTSSIYRGSTLLGHGWGAVWGAPRHPQAVTSKLLPPNLPHFHQFEPFSSNFFDKFGSFWWIWGRFGGK